MTTVATRPGRSVAVLRLRDPATYRCSLHLLLDLPLGVLAISTATTLLAVSVGLAITLVGIPLLTGTLVVARLFGRAERFRAGGLLDVEVPDPALAPHGWRGRLADPSGWRALGYAVLLGPVGVLTGTLTLTGWAIGLAAVTFPAYAWALDDPALHLGGLTVGGVPAAVGAVVCGLLVLAVMPALTGLLGRLDTALVRGLLH